MSISFFLCEDSVLLPDNVVVALHRLPVLLLHLLLVLGFQIAHVSLVLLHPFPRSTLTIPLTSIRLFLCLLELLLFVYFLGQDQQVLLFALQLVSQDLQVLLVAFMRFLKILSNFRKVFI